MKLNPIPAPSVKKLEPHPHSKIMPPQSEEEFNNLATDIGKNGVLHPIVLYQGKILDGVHRCNVLAVYEFKKPATWVEFEGTDAEAKAFVISANIHRRHLTPEKRREIIGSLLEADPTQSNRAIGEATKTDHKTVASVRAEKVATGEIPQLEKTVGKDGKARGKSKEKSKDKSKGDKHTIKYAKVVDFKTAHDAYKVFETHLLDAVEELAEQSTFAQAETYAQATIERLQEKLSELQPEQEAA